MSEPVTYYGMFYTDGSNEKFVNMSHSRSVDPRDIYLKSAQLCSKSIKSAGGNFILLTNDCDALAKRAFELNIADLHIKKFEFSLAVPEGIKFYSAHFKLDIIREFGTGSLGSCVALIDIDTVMLRPIKIRSGINVYNITQQVVPAYGSRVINRDVSRIAGYKVSDACWFGGEVIAGKASDFSSFSRHIDECWNVYLGCYGDLHHVGDEAVTTAALLSFVRHGGEIALLNDHGVARWWSIQTKHKQIRFRDASSSCLLHLPADKEFLARESKNEFDAHSFLSAYRKIFRYKYFLKLAKYLVSTVVFGRKVWIPRL